MSDVRQDSLTKLSGEKYQKQIHHKIIFLIVSFLILLLSMGFAVSIGAISIPIQDVFSTVYSFIFSKEYTVDSGFVDIIINIRLPRVLMGCVVGMSLGVCGIIMQMILQNPMASPFTLGVSSGAAFGAAIAIIYPVSLLGVQGKSMIIVSSFFFSMLVCMIILLLTKWRSASSRNLILSGIAIMYFFKAVTSLLTYFSDVYASREIMMWQVGSLWKSNWEILKLTTIVFVFIFPYFLYKAIDLNKMALGDEVATGLGVKVMNSRQNLMVAVALLTATVTAFTGTISFVGLVIPHIMGSVVGFDNRFLIPASAIGGGILLVIADSIALNIIAPLVLPVGVLTAFIGSPLFLYMILKEKNS